MQPFTQTAERGIIMAVDDDTEDIDLMRLLFRKAGLSAPIQVYHRGEDLLEALGHFLKRTVDAAVLPLLCFLDVKMPSMSGHDVLRWIRQHSQFDALSVVMLSSSEHPDDVQQAAQQGAQCYLSKYPQPAVLRAVIEEAERISGDGTAIAKEWFGVSANLLLRWGVPRGTGSVTRVDGETFRSSGREGR